MTLLILVALAIPLVLGYLGIIGWQLIVAAEIGILLVVGWRFDRGRKVGARDPFADRNRADFAAPFAATIPPLPKEAIEDPAGRPGAG
jgi:hypothetical protein